MTILCGTDFSEDASKAVTVAAELALRAGERLELVHCLDLPAGEIQTEAERERHSAVALKLEQRAKQLQSEGVDVVAQVVLAEATLGLMERARQLSARLIVVGTRGESAGEGRIGSRADRLAGRSRIPVLLVRDAEPFRRWLAHKRPLRVLLGADTSNATAAALNFIEGLREVGPCEVSALHLFWPPAQFERLGFGGARSVVDVDPEVRRAIGEELAERLGSIPVQLEPHLGNIGEELARAAVRAQADVVVVGTHGRSGAARFWHGSVSHGVLHVADLDVACVPMSAVTRLEPTPFRRVLVATDFSELGNSAIRLAYSALAQGGTAHLLHVLPARQKPALEPTDILEPELGAAPDPLRERALAGLREVAEPDAAESGRTSEFHVVSSNQPARAIAQVAERLRVDLICLGTHSQSGVVQAVLGSVALGVLKHTRRPVLLAQLQP